MPDFLRYNIVSGMDVVIILINVSHGKMASFDKVS